MFIEVPLIKKRQTKLRKYMKVIDATYNTSSGNKNECLKRLDEIRAEIMDLIQRGKIIKYVDDKELR